VQKIVSKKAPPTPKPVKAAVKSEGVSLDISAEDFDDDEA
jgi:hypothetical protein